MHTLTGHAGKVYGAVLSPDGRLVVSGGTDKKVKIWDPRSGYCVRTVHTPSIVNGVAVNPQASRIASAHQDAGLRLWDIRNGARLREEKGRVHGGAVTSVAFSADGARALGAPFSPPDPPRTRACGPCRPPRWPPGSSRPEGTPRR